FTSFLDLLEDPLKEHGFKFLRFDGKTPAGKRSKMINTFQNDPKYKIFLISLKAGGVGLNLTAANRVILMDIWWNPAMENQAIDRVHRIGQKKEVHVHRLFINQSIENTILELQAKKQVNLTLRNIFYYSTKHIYDTYYSIPYIYRNYMKVLLQKVKI
ncbi:P-loop containing nucleoside triphosphate hydrolase protein, partial [Circinella umbellata]